jgi:nucleoside-diphosphate-sugar epimerase
LKGEPGGVYNIGRGSAVSIGELLETMLRSSHATIEIRVDPSRLRQVDAPLQICDARRFQGQTQWEALIPLDRTLDDILGYWRARVTAAQEAGCGS